MFQRMTIEVNQTALACEIKHQEKRNTNVAKGKKETDWYDPRDIKFMICDDEDEKCLNEKSPMVRLLLDILKW